MHLSHFETFLCLKTPSRSLEASPLPTPYRCGGVSCTYTERDENIGGEETAVRPGPSTSYIMIVPET